jgi:deoxyribose-phosphate aldolase
MNPACHIDHTLLKPDATHDQIRTLCEQAAEYQFAAVCIPPVYVALAAELLYGSGVEVATVVGFPLGYCDPRTKVFETRVALERGATEIDMVIPLGAARENDFSRVGDEVAAVVEAAPNVPVKVILETALFAPQIVKCLAETVLEAGAAMLKTSTGFGPGGATLEMVRLLAQVADGHAGVKAAGGIRDWPTCSQYLRAGATRIGTSNALQIMAQWQSGTDR